MRLPALLVILTIAAGTCHAQTVQSFTLQKGQALRIMPDGKVDVFATMQGNAGHVAEMDKRAQPVTKGLGVWFSQDGKLQYIADPVEGAATFEHHEAK
jgi:hypothetical protein